MPTTVQFVCSAMSDTISMIITLALLATIRFPIANTATMSVSGNQFAQIVWQLTSLSMDQAVSLARVWSRTVLIVFRVEVTT